MSRTARTNDPAQDNVQLYLKRYEEKEMTLTVGSGFRFGFGFVLGTAFATYLAFQIFGKDIQIPIVTETVKKVVHHHLDS
jgi:tetrahydromethanopterin S-methyltransferase subunit B